MDIDNNPDFKEKAEFLKWQLTYVIDQIKMADYKINFLLAIYLAMLGIVVSQIVRMVGIFQSPYVCLLWKIFVGAIIVVFLLCIINFFYRFINTVRPRTNPSKILGQNNYKSSIFWKDVSGMDYKNFKNITLKANYKDLMKEVFVNSYIARVKFENVTNAYKSLALTIISFITIFVLISII